MYACVNALIVESETHEIYAYMCIPYSRFLSFWILINKVAKIWVEA
jgi:hypothetical protein